MLHISDFLTDLAYSKKDLQVILYPSGWYVVFKMGLRKWQSAIAPTMSFSCLIYKVSHKNGRMPVWESHKVWVIESNSNKSSCHTARAVAPLHVTLAFSNA